MEEGNERLSSGHGTAVALISRAAVLDSTAHDWALEIQSGLAEGPSCSPSNWQDSYWGGVTVYSDVATTELRKGH